MVRGVQGEESYHHRAGGFGQNFFSSLGRCDRLESPFPPLGVPYPGLLSIHHTHWESI
jgi:hypothetical protein